jgi:hypothetical protein
MRVNSSDMSEVQESGKPDQIKGAEFHATDWHIDSDTAQINSAVWIKFTT